MKRNVWLSIKMIALPREHGAWGFTIEPLLLGLLVVWSVPNALLALATFLTFLAHQPVKIFFSSYKAKRKSALLFIIGYGSAGVFAFYFYLTRVSLQAGLPVYGALGMMFFYLILDLLHWNKRIYIEIIAPAAIGLMTMSMALSAGWGTAESLALWLLLLTRSIPTAFYVHARLQSIKRQPSGKKSALTVHILSVLLAAFLISEHLLPVLALFGVLNLLLRAVYGLFLQKAGTVRRLGIMEFVYGLQLVFFTVIGYWFHF